MYPPHLAEAECALKELAELVDCLMRQPETDRSEFERLNEEVRQLRSRMRSMYEAWRTEQPTSRHVAA